MKITADTNVLARFLVRDDERQAQAAAEALRAAEVVAISTACLCELAWVLGRAYRFSREQIADAFDALLEMENVSVDQSAAAAGLGLLKSGGDFADGAIAHGGLWLGGETFVSFDRRAVQLIARQGQGVQLLTGS